jgi:hypothetical protein
LEVVCGVCGREVVPERMRSRRAVAAAPPTRHASACRGRGWGASGAHPALSARLPGWILAESLGAPRNHCKPPRSSSGRGIGPFTGTARSRASPYPVADSRRRMRGAYERGAGPDGARSTARPDAGVQSGSEAGARPSAGAEPDLESEPVSGAGAQAPGTRRWGRRIAQATLCAVSLALLEAALERSPARGAEPAFLGFLRVLVDHPLRSWLALTLLWAGLGKAGFQPGPDEPPGAPSPSPGPSPAGPGARQRTSPGPSNHTYGYGTLGVTVDCAEPDRG